MKLLAFVDRSVDDPEWKGSIIWSTLLALADSQHDVLVLTPASVSLPDITHPRMQIVQPIQSWSALQILRLVPVIMNFKPDIIHLFAPQTQSSAPWPTLWPTLQGFLQTVWPVRRVVTLFDPDDWDPSLPHFRFLAGADVWTVFTLAHAHLAKRAQAKAVEILPVESSPLVTAPEEAEANVEFHGGKSHLIPASADQWSHLAKEAVRLRESLAKDGALTAKIVGGFGRLTVADKRSFWATLGDFGERIEMLPAWSSWQLQEALAQRPSIDLRPISELSWSHTLVTHLASTLDLPFTAARGDWPKPEIGSTANSLSRLYANS